MSIETALSSLNAQQRNAATLPDQHALVLAGAGTGKTKTIVARAAYLIDKGVSARRIRILTFTRRAASEVCSRVKGILGDQAEALQASTFHTWCMGLIRRAPNAFGVEGVSVIDQEDQLQIFKALRGNAKCDINALPPASELSAMYSYARNTGQSLTETLENGYADYLRVKSDIVLIMKGYEKKKTQRNYLDYDDILDLVAQRINESPKVCEWVGKQYDHLLVDEMQDTNPLQWSLLSPLKEYCHLFCVGDDAQSIYGFRGADFQNVHSFKERVPGSVILKLNDNYRSTQEILDVANWLLADSPLKYDKALIAARGEGIRPQLHNFSSEWDEGQWIVSNIKKRRADGDRWKDHMVLTRSAFSARVVENLLLQSNIPYRFIGGVKLLESAHVRDLLSLLRIIGNPLDEIAYMRYLTLFSGVGEATAARIAEQAMAVKSLEKVLRCLRSEKKLLLTASAAIEKVAQQQTNVAKAVTLAAKSLDKILENKYRNQEWPKRKRDFELVAKLAEKHTNILAFIEEYLLDPVHASMVTSNNVDDVVTVITVHSGKGTECKTCYVINVSPGSYPSTKSIVDVDKVEEERRVLYVALTRAQDNLIVTRQNLATWAIPGSLTKQGTDYYFLNNLPKGLFDVHTHNRHGETNAPPNIQSQQYQGRGINYN
jgi:DNA helicase-2/ATP-dependent DNA helicase PcrA